MKSFDSRVYSVNDFREWDRNGQLVLSPRFQRRAVWSDVARSFLMDTIVRGLPIPKIFLRQLLDPYTGSRRREVVDGQQRLRTILAYVSDGFVIRSGHNSEFGGLYFSQLEDFQQVALLNYEISTDLLVNMPDSQVLDVFSRLNSHAVVLNEQEKINASHFGEFKQLVDELAHMNFEYWVRNRVLRESQVVRMADASLTADLLIAICDGIQSKKQIRSYYASYERDFGFDTDVLRRQFQQTLSALGDLYPEGFGQSEFHRVHLHYSLFLAVYDLLFGLRGSSADFDNASSFHVDRARQRLDRVETVFDSDRDEPLDSGESTFLNDSRRATTDASVRVRRTRYLVEQMTQR